MTIFHSHQNRHKILIEPCYYNEEKLTLNQGVMTTYTKDIVGPKALQMTDEERREIETFSQDRASEAWRVELEAGTSQLFRPDRDDYRMDPNKIWEAHYKGALRVNTDAFHPSSTPVDTTNLGGGHHQADGKRMSPEEMEKAGISTAANYDGIEEDMQWKPNPVVDEILQQGKGSPGSGRGGRG